MSENTVLPPAIGNYEIDRQRHLWALQKRLPGEEEKMSWPLEKLHRLRDERLRDLVRVAKAHSPWHARRLRHIDPDTLHGDDLSRIPPMTKADLMVHWDEIVTDRRLTLDLARRHLARVSEEGPAYLLDQYHVVTSGGTSGQHGIIVWDFEGWLQAFLVRYRALTWLTRHGIIETIARTASVQAASPVHPSISREITFRDPLNSWRSFPATLPIAEIVNGLNAYQPDRIAVYPLLLPQLISEARAGRLQIAPKIFTCGSEPLSAEARQGVAEVFGVPITSWYASAENAVMAMSYPVQYPQTDRAPLRAQAKSQFGVQSRSAPAFDRVYPGKPKGSSDFIPGSSSLHLIEDVAIYEPVDPDGRPVAPGTRSTKMFVTNVKNHVMPLIRYEIDDEVLMLDKPVVYPWTGRQISPVQGRNGESFSYPGEIEVHPALFSAVLGAEVAIGAAQVYQTERGADIRIVPAGNGSSIDLETVKQKLVAGLCQHGIALPEVTVTLVDQLERQSATGKVRRFIPIAR
jgi:phenylacetate-CoA ligase